MGREAFVTLATNDTYCKGAVVLAHSLRKHNTQKEIVVMITPQVSHECKLLLELVFDQIVCVNILDSKDDAHLALLKRPELGVTFTKIHCWNLTEYDKCVFMDADTMALMNVDELFDREELSAAPDAGWPDMFNSGVFVYKPSRDTYLALIKLADDEGSFDGGDQGLLNTYFNTWATSDSSKRLSFLYNMHSTSTYTYCPAFARFGKDTKVVHFIGSVKPWHHKYSAESDTVLIEKGPGIHEQAYLLEWWHLLTELLDCYHATRQVHQPASPEPCRHELWRKGQIDYTGIDSFEKIQQKLDMILIGACQSTEATPACRKPEPTTTYRKPEPTPTCRKPEPTPTCRKPEPTTTYRKPEPTPTCRKPEPTPTYRKPEPTPTCRKPEPTTTYRKPEPTPTCRKPEPTPTCRKPEPTPTCRKPEPTPTYRKPEPTPTCRKPEPTPTCRKPEPTPTYRKPEPTPTCRKPEPTSTYRKPEPTPICRKPEPTPTCRKPGPTSGKPKQRSVSPTTKLIQQREAAPFPCITDWDEALEGCFIGECCLDTFDFYVPIVPGCVIS